MGLHLIEFSFFKVLSSSQSHVDFSFEFFLTFEELLFCVRLHLSFYLSRFISDEKLISVKSEEVKKKRR